MWHRVLGAGQSNADADVETCLSVSWMGFEKVKIKKLLRNLNICHPHRITIG